MTLPVCPPKARFTSLRAPPGPDAAQPRMPQVRDEHGQLWIVSEYIDVDWPEPRVPLRDVDELRHATLSFKTPDGRHARILRNVAPLDWHACNDDTLRLWLRMARPAQPSAGK